MNRITVSEVTANAFAPFGETCSLEPAEADTADDTLCRLETPAAFAA